MDDWFLEEFGPYGFSLTPMIYDPNSFAPNKSVIDPNGVLTHVKVTPELADDLKGWGVAHDFVTEAYKDLIRQTLKTTYPEIFKPKDFIPQQRLGKFKF